MDKDMIIESLMKQVADLTALVQTLTDSDAYRVQCRLE